MNSTYPARYKDWFSEEITAIFNDGKTLTMVVRGVRFQGSDFDSFEPLDGSDPAQLASFTFFHGSLCNCIIEADILIPVVTAAVIADGLLTFELELGEPLPTCQMDRERLKVWIAFNGQKYVSEGKTGWFEDEMLDLQKSCRPTRS